MAVKGLSGIEDKSLTQNEATQWTRHMAELHKHRLFKSCLSRLTGDEESSGSGQSFPGGEPASLEDPLAAAGNRSWIGGAREGSEGEPNMTRLLVQAYLTSAALGSGSPSRHLNLAMHGAAGKATDPSSAAASRPSGASSGESPKELGALSARFESGSLGIDAIGYDSRGGTSYGLYQIASRPGSMDRFLDFLEEEAPRWASRLKSAGPANTGGKSGGMPREWREIAAEDPDGFARLQHEFIRRTHYEPALADVREKTGVDVASRSRALKEVLWSTSVHHGPSGARHLFEKAVTDLEKKDKSLSDENLIDRIYARRTRYVGGFGARMRSSLHQRFREEKSLALAMLQGKGAVA